VVGLVELEHKRQELDRRRATLLAQQRQLDAIAEQRLELRAVADGIEAFCQTVRSGLATATFAQRRLLVELLIDRVVVTDGEVEIRYVLPTSPDGPHPPFCHLRKDHLDGPAPARDPNQHGQRHRAGHGAAVVGQLAGALVTADHEPVLPGLLARRRAVVVQAEKRPVVVAVAFGAFAGRHLLPCPRGDLPEQGVGTLGGAAEGHVVVAGDRQHVANAAGLKGGPQPGVLTP
jgi:hypothetical protein